MTSKHVVHFEHPRSVNLHGISLLTNHGMATWDGPVCRTRFDHFVYVTNDGAEVTCRNCQRTLTWRFPTFDFPPNVRMRIVPKGSFR